MALACAVSLAACSTQVASEPARSDDTRSGKLAADAVHPVSGLPVIMLKVTSGKKAHGFAVEVADTPEQQARGLMFRTELGPDEGMLFPSHPPGIRSFWMKNTPLPLDIIFVGTDGRILNIAAQTEPYSLQSLRSDGIASAVLELRGGRAAELGIAPGDRVEYRLP